MKWKCERCGHEQPRHPDTRPEDMPRCDQRVVYMGSAFATGVRAGVFVQEDERDHTNKWLPRGSCGGSFQAL